MITSVFDELHMGQSPNPRLSLNAGIFLRRKAMRYFMEKIEIAIEKQNREIYLYHDWEISS